MWHSMTSCTLICLLIVVVSCCLMCDHVTGSPTFPEKRGIRRYPRARYRVGYMFGKRSSSSTTTTTLFDIISRGMITKKEMEALILKDEDVLREVVAILDKNSDGYISLADVL